MRLTSSRPNIVTYTTIIRAIGMPSSTSVDAHVCLRFLEHARTQETFDESLFLDALDVCSIRHDLETAMRVLKEMAVYSTTLRDSERLIIMLQRVVDKCLVDQDKVKTLQEWVQAGLITQNEMEGCTPGTSLSAMSSPYQGIQSVVSCQYMLKIDLIHSAQVSWLSRTSNVRDRATRSG
jgi:hypothetical protein